MTAPNLSPGHVVAGKYTLRSLLGYNGATASYHATDAQGGQVVLKLLDPAIGQRADVMAALERITSECHPLAGASVLPFLDAGYDAATGAPFRVAEYLGIPSLARLVENGPLSEDVTTAIVRGASIALDAAHARGLFHHALKPSNLFVGPAPHYPVLVADFGARLILDAIPTQELYGLSAPWLAPEQLYPGTPVGAAADVYTMALLAFYALTGRPYWWSCQTSPPDLQAWQQEVVAQHVPVSMRARELGRTLNATLDGVFARALSANPADRPASVGELALGLAGQGAAAAPPPASAMTQAMGQFGGYPPAAAVVAAAPQPVVPGGERTMAFEMSPAGPGALPPGSGYDLAPAAASPGGYQPPPPPAAPGGYESQQAMAAPPPMQTVAAAPPMTPGLPAFPQPAPKRAPAGMMPIIVGVVAAIVLGGITVVWLFLRSPGGTAATGPDTIPVSGSGEPSAPAAGSTSGASTEAGSDAGAVDAKSDGGVEADKTVEVRVACIPAPCETLSVDGEAAADPSAPLRLLPGKHQVQVSKGGYQTRIETIEVELGAPVEKKLALSPAIPAPTGTGTPTKKKCGKFLERCN